MKRRDFIFTIFTTLIALRVPKARKSALEKPANNPIVEEEEKD